VQFCAGAVDQGVCIDGGRINYGDADHFTLVDFEIALLVLFTRLPAVGEYGYGIFTKYANHSSAASEYGLYMHRAPVPGSLPQWQLVGDGSSGVVSDPAVTPIVTGRWYCVRAVVRGTQAEIWVDGQLAASGTVNRHFNNTSTPVIIGNASTGQNYFYGLIDEVRFGCPSHETVELLATKDSCLRGGFPHLNEGANPGLVVRQNGGVRSLVDFDLGSVSSSGWTRASLVLTINDEMPPSEWGEGRPVGVHRVMQAWTEGNGKKIDLPPSEQDRGSGAGVTWDCPTDTDIANQAPDCEESWAGAETAIAAATAPNVTITNGMSGEVVWDVTQDVLDALAGGEFHGWLVLKETIGHGNVRFHSREGATAAGDSLLGPRLILHTPELLRAREANADLATASPTARIIANHPNPFNPTTMLSIDLSSSGHVSLRIYDVSGRLVADLIDQRMEAGRHEVRWNGKDTSGMRVGTGIYYARIVMGNASFSHKLMMIK
jgi:hypothetical protein